MADEYSLVRLPIELLVQKRSGECLAACAVMVLRSLQVSVDYVQLVRMLEITDIGAPFSRLLRLETLGVKVTLSCGTLPLLHRHLVRGLPSIVAVDTRELPYWRSVASPHAVVVCGMNRHDVLLLDPAFATGPFLVTHGDFDLAWLERDEQYATITR